MLKSIDQALAGAIDVIADDVQATVKSVREQGMMRTLGDAVEDAAGLVVGGAGTALSGMLSGKKGCSRADVNGVYVQQSKFCSRRPVFYCAAEHWKLSYDKDDDEGTEISGKTKGYSPDLATWSEDGIMMDLPLQHE
eukprot:symbB.v1.2.003767.t1/scaffold207.1/size268535/14